MKSRNYCVAFLTLMFVLACFHISVVAQSSDDNRLAKVSGGGSTIRFDIAVSYSSATVTIATPDERVVRKEFSSGASVEMALADAKGERYGDGMYTYEIRVAPIFSAGVKEELTRARAKGNEEEVLRDMRKKGILQNQPTVQSGSFSVVHGSIILPGAIEETRADQRASNTVEQPSTIKLTPAGQAKLRRHHTLLMAPFDFVIADDLIVQGSACVGLDCVNGEVFGFDTIRVKENNTRIQFDDTSGVGFPTNNWQIRANSSAGGGQSFLGFVDQGAAGNSETGTIVFEVDAGAPANSLRVSSLGRVGNRTATPVLDVHTNTNNTPAMRLEQNNTGGFTAQTWDIAGNEANFFVRDVTGGSLLPFRIRPGAPTSSLDISSSGNVGIGTGSPDALLQVEKDQATGTEIRVNNSNTTNGFAGLYLNSGFALATGGLVQYNNITGAKNLFVTTGGADPLHLGTNNSIRMTILANTGLVGIATTAPTDTLSVNGTASKPGGGSWAVFSDERLKTIKGSFTRGLKAAMQLQPVRYEYKASNALGLKSGTENIGFGAQQLQQVIPEAVTTNANGYLQVNNDPIIWTMLNAIKEQQQEILKLKKEIRQLRTASRKRK